MRSEGKYVGEMTLWRISNHVTLDGNGGKRAGARWHSLGRRIVYLADHPMSAIVETLVKISVPKRLRIESLQLPDGEIWKHEMGITRSVGDAWIASLKSPLARVPSVIAPHTWNYLLNPLHPDAAQVKIEEVIRERFDNRLFGFGAR